MEAGFRSGSDIFPCQFAAADLSSSNKRPSDFLSFYRQKKQKKR
jgi:hypothetical protein